MDAIYQKIWNVDQSGAGVPALRVGEEKNDQIGFVVVDEKPPGVDPKHRVFKEVKIPEHKMHTYKLCEKLFDNYALERAANETVRDDESQEELDLIDAVLPTRPIQIARNYLQKKLNRRISDANLAIIIKETWFRMGTSGKQDDASGFEHVFVGEQAKTKDKIGGYHFWYKYHLDDGGRNGDLIKYEGTNYSRAKEPEKGILIPEVVTLALEWNAPGGDGGTGHILTKGLGGFFVGCSPECLIALGLVCCRVGGYNNLTRINGVEYNLFMDRLKGRPKSIRTFFPMFISADVIEIVTPEPAPEPVPPPVTPIDASNLPFRIIAAMVNPPNPEGGREFIQIINTSNETQSLLKWRVVAPNETAFVLDEIPVDPGEVFKFQIPMNQGVLRNSSGAIRLLDPAGTLVQSCAYSSDEAAREGSLILFSPK